MEDSLYKEIGRRIKEFREERGITQQEISDNIHLSRTSITNIEAGRQKIQIHILYQIATLLKVEPNQLLPNINFFVEEIELPEKYKELDYEGQEFVKKIIVKLHKMRGDHESKSWYYKCPK